MQEQALSDKEIILLYRNIVMYYEMECGERRYWVKEKNLQEYLKINHLFFDVGAINKPRPKEQEFLSGRCTGFWFLDKKENQVASLFSHLRNSVAHCKVSCRKIRNRWYYCFVDQDKGRVTMLGKLPKKLLPGFVQALKNSEKKHHLQS